MRAGVIVGHALVAGVAVLVVVGEDASGVLELLGWFDGVGVVEPEDAGAIGLMQRQAVGDAMGNPRGGLDPPGLDLDPVAAALVEDAAVQVQQG